MEDILASIRRILSEDEVAAGASAAPEAPPASNDAGDSGVLVLDPAMIRGNRVELAEGERVRVSGPPIDEQTIGRIREQKPALVRLLSSEQP